MKSSLLHILLFLITFPLFAQQSVFEPNLITTGERIFEYERISGDSKSTFGTVYERISRDNEKGTFNIVFFQEMPNATVVDSIIVSSSTLEPQFYRSIVPEMQDIKVHYTIPGTTVVDLFRNFSDQAVDTTMFVKTNTRVFDFHWPHLLLYAIGSLQRVDDVINLPVFTYSNKMSMQLVSYKGIETIELHDKKYVATVWKTTDSDSSTEKTYWIDRETNRLLQNKSILTDGTIFWFRQKKETK